jgi:hypothetical protein
VEASRSLLDLAANRSSPSSSSSSLSSIESVKDVTPPDTNACAAKKNYEDNADNSRSGAFGRVLSYDGQTLSRSEDVGHRFDPFFIQTPFPPMPCAFGEVGCNIGSSKHHEKAPGRPLPWCHRGQPLFRERRVVGQRAPPPLIQRARAARTYA